MVQPPSTHTKELPESLIYTRGKREPEATFTNSSSFKDLNQRSPIFIPVCPPYRGSFDPALLWEAHLSLRCGTAVMFDHSVKLRTLSHEQP